MVSSPERNRIFNTKIYHQSQPSQRDILCELIQRVEEERDNESIVVSVKQLKYLRDIIKIFEDESFVFEVFNNEIVLDMDLME